MTTMSKGWTGDLMTYHVLLNTEKAAEAQQNEYTVVSYAGRLSLVHSSAKMNSTALVFTGEQEQKLLENGILEPGENWLPVLFKMWQGLSSFKRHGLMMGTDALQKDITRYVSENWVEILEWALGDEESAKICRSGSVEARMIAEKILIEDAIIRDVLDDWRGMYSYTSQWRAKFDIWMELQNARFAQQELEEEIRKLKEEQVALSLKVLEYQKQTEGYAPTSSMISKMAAGMMERMEKAHEPTEEGLSEFIYVVDEHGNRVEDFRPTKEEVDALLNIDPDPLDAIHHPESEFGDDLKDTGGEGGGNK